ncbi:DUF6350 family protein [Umezawaea endophytica]|uniref:DUF6350 family protein n=1 Tax=Umezawaea endophytica TaxID=1654476 RepID=A0A9X2VSV2_9PSEU|nr:DUF6350 family protein [Umezawaea endophytica]MCS7482238.1 DUF6350 family protein [Umezawaea endophytica]
MLQPSTHGGTDVRPPEFSRPERVRVLVMTAAGSVVIGYAAVAALLALIAATATNAAFSTTGVLTAAAPGWLVAHHVPLRFEGSAQLGVLPLLPTALLMLLAGRAAAGAADRLGLYEPLQARGVVFCIAGAHAITGGTIALLMGDGPVRATPAVAFFGCAAVSGVAATIGVAQRCGLVEVLIDRIDPVARRGMRAGLLALFVLGGLGSLLVALGLAFSWTTTSGLFAGADSTFGVGLGLFLLCLGYLPNAVVAALSYVVGAGFSIGPVSMTPTRFVGGDVPAVPLLAALPEARLGFLSGLLLLPLVLGGVVGWYCRKISDRPSTRLRAVLVAGVTVAVVSLVLAATAGGNLGDGPFNPVTVPAGLLSVLVLGWIVVPGSFVAWFAGPRPKRAPAAEAPAVEQIPDEDEAVAEDAEEGEDYDEYEDYEDADEELALEDELAEEFEESEDDYDELLDETDEAAEDELDEDFDDDPEDAVDETPADVEETGEPDVEPDDDPDDGSPEPDLTGKAR